ncbi:integrase core domain-containing protein [Paracoccaceae bacterium Fryx2]|nr:integrase core domain-containing protein [Paracoccaceae bacterium Fryx2]
MIALRYLWLNQQIRHGRWIAATQVSPRGWRYEYNNVRPHSSLGDLTPAQARRAPEQSDLTAPGARAQTKTDEDRWCRGSGGNLKAA